MLLSTANQNELNLCKPIHGLQYNKTCGMHGYQLINKKGRKKMLINFIFKIN